MFGSDSPAAPKTPDPPPPPPTVEDVTVKAQNQADALRRRRGTASTILAGSDSATSSTQPITSAARLLGG